MLKFLLHSNDLNTDRLPSLAFYQAFCLVHHNPFLIAVIAIELGIVDVKC